MNKILDKQLLKVQRKEEEFLAQKGKNGIAERIDPLREKIEKKIPNRLRFTMEAAFEKSFEFLFEKGDPYIEKTFRKNQKQIEHDVLDLALDRGRTRSSIRRMDGTAHRSKWTNTSLSVLEGGVLGFLGIGLPDIPIFIGVILRSLFEIGISYGFDHKTEAEKAYILLLMCGALSEGEERENYSQRIDALAKEIDEGMYPKISLSELTGEASKTLANSLLLAKFIQGIPVAGTVGGVVNYRIIRKVSRFAAVKYKKRYLLKKTAR